MDPGQKITEPAIPTRPGWVFTGWYRNLNNPASKWDFDNDTLTSNITLHAAYEWGPNWPISRFDQLESYLRWAPMNTRNDDARYIPLAVVLNDPGIISAGNRIIWTTLLQTIYFENRYIEELDISQSYRGGNNALAGYGLDQDGVFDFMNYGPYGSNGGMFRIRKLILPTEAIALENSDGRLLQLDSLRSIEGENVKTVAPNLFEGNPVLKTVIFPNATSIGSKCFKDCGVTYLYIPKILHLGDYVFAKTTGSAAAQKTIIMGNTAPIVGVDTFANNYSGDVTVKVPPGATGYGTLPITSSVYLPGSNWFNGFRGLGWDGTSTISNTVAAWIKLTVEVE